MARSTLYVSASSDAVGTLAQQELVATFESALATLVADGASPTQAHVTAANNAYTNVKAVWAKDFVIDFDRANINTSNLKLQAIRALLAQIQNLG